MAGNQRQKNEQRTRTVKTPDVKVTREETEGVGQPILRGMASENGGLTLVQQIELGQIHARYALHSMREVSRGAVDCLLSEDLLAPFDDLGNPRYGMLPNFGPNTKLTVTITVE